MLAVFQVCFFVGLGLTVLSFLFGSLFEAAGIDGLDLDFDFLDADIFLPISPVLCFLFLTVFGGLGWILSGTFSGGAIFLAFLISSAAGIAVSAFMYRFVVKPLRKAENTSAPSEEDLIGVLATVTETIMKDGFGEIRYMVNGNSFTGPAKNAKEGEIKAGTEVAVCWIKEYVFYVIPMEEDMQSQA